MERRTVHFIPYDMVEKVHTLYVLLYYSTTVDMEVHHARQRTRALLYQTPACVLDWNESVSLWSYESANVGMHNT